MKNIDMVRKEFLMTSGMMVTAALISNLSAESATPKRKRDAFPRRVNPDAFSAPILKAITLGLNAPNPHNTQAWKFRIVSDSVAFFYVDENKLLPATDPPSRQIHIGCGCFIGLFRMAAVSLGYNATVEYFPEGACDFRDIGKKSLAKLSLTKAHTFVDSLVNQIYLRQTNRLPYSDSVPSDEEFNAILKLSKPTSSSIAIIKDNETLNPLLEVLYEGMEVECYDWRAYEESRQWFRVKDDIALKRDGINLRVNGLKGSSYGWRKLASVIIPKRSGTMKVL